MRKQHLFPLTILFLFISISASAQSPGKSMYFELGGPGFASVNYDMRFQKTQDGLGFRVGVGGFSIDGEGALFVPVGLNYLIGKETKHYFEIGGGATFVNATDFSIGSDNSDNTAVFGFTSFGYRYQPAANGFVFRAAMVPIFGKGFFIPYYAGISFGYKF
ncbi:hypothetical protein BH11BAC5_BH11BAC5_10500 [soil metagenome]